MLNVYGIKNCNTVKKALDWLNAHKIEYTFHDYKKEPAEEKQLIAWQKLVPWESLINKKGTTWKKLNPEQQAAVVDEKSAREILLAHNSMIKRPLIELENELILGFDEQLYTEKLLK